MKLTVVIKGNHSRVLRYTSLSAKRDGAADDVKAARRSWSRVAKRVLKSKNPVTRARWLKRLKTVTAYMVRRLQSVPKKKKVSAKLKAQIDYGKVCGPVQPHHQSPIWSVSDRHGETC